MWWFIKPQKSVSKKNSARLDVWPFEDSDGVVVVWCGRYYLGSILVIAQMDEQAAG